MTDLNGHDLEFAQRLQEVADRSVRNEGRIKKLESENNVLHQLATSVAVMAEQLKAMNTKVGTLTEKVDDIEARPAKRWESVVAACISVLVGAVLGFVLSRVGL